MLFWAELKVGDKREDKAMDPNPNDDFFKKSLLDVPYFLCFKNSSIYRKLIYRYGLCRIHKSTNHSGQSSSINYSGLAID
jgi:hypothetical protein